MSKSKKKKRKQVIKEIEEMNLIIEFLTDNTVYYYLEADCKIKLNTFEK